MSTDQRARDMKRAIYRLPGVHALLTKKIPEFVYKGFLNNL